MTISQDLTGTITYPQCQTPGTLTVQMKAGNSGFTASGTYPCPNYTGTSFVMTFAADCNSATGTATLPNGTLNDTWTTNRPVQITQPTADSTQAFTAGNNFSATDPVTFTATSSADASSPINWSLSLYYATSGNRGATTLTRSFTSTPGADHGETFASQGGQLTITAAQGDNNDKRTAYVVGVGIPNGTITARLRSLYSGATPDLLAQIAMQESTYAQFATRSLFGTRAAWPKESYDGGSHIGLMQVPVSMTNAFDWSANTQAGANVFNGMLGYAQTRENQLRAANPGLPALSAVQRENNALSMYNTGTAVSNLYYAVNTATTPPSWVVNAANTRGVGYANSVRAQVVPN